MRDTRHPGEIGLVERFRYEAARYGYWRAGVVFTWRRTRRAVKEALLDALDEHDRRVRARRKRAYMLGHDDIGVRAFADSTDRWGCSVGV